MTCCNCHNFTVTPTGGLSVGSVATLSIDAREGGVVVAGRAKVEIANDVWDGLEAVYPLDAVSTGATGEFEDLSRSGLDATGGMSGHHLPSRADGVYCLYAQDFSDNGLIVAPQDGITTGPYAFSFWLKVDDAWNSSTVLVRQGATRVSYSILRHIFFEVFHAEGSTLINSSSLEQDRWYHVACEYGGDNLTVYINGSSDGTIEVTEDTLTPSGDTYIGYYDTQACMQELRIYPEAKGSAWYTAEYRNFCDCAFIEEDTCEDSPVYS